MSPEETRELERARALARWVDDRDEGGRLRPLPDEIDADAGEAMVALRPDLAPGPYVDADDIVALLDEHERLDAFLDGDPGDSLDPDVMAAAVALRPERAPAPKVSIDDILARVTSGPFAELQPQSFHGTETEVRGPEAFHGTETEVRGPEAFHGTETELRPTDFHGTETELSPANAPIGQAGANKPFAEPKKLEGSTKVRRRGILPWLLAGGGTAGFATLVMAAVALFVILPKADVSQEAAMPLPPAAPMAKESAKAPIAEATAPAMPDPAPALDGMLGTTAGVRDASPGGGGASLGSAAAKAAEGSTAPVGGDTLAYRPEDKYVPVDEQERAREDLAADMPAKAEAPAAAPPPPVVTESTAGAAYDTVVTMSSKKPQAARDERRTPTTRGASAPATASNTAVYQTGEADDTMSTKELAEERAVPAPNLGDEATRIRALEAEAEQLAAQGRLLDAATKLTPAIGTNAGIAHWYGAKVARWQLAGGSPAAAEATCKKALGYGKTSPQAPALYLVYGEVLDRMGRTSDAEKMYDAAAR